MSVIHIQLRCMRSTCQLILQLLHARDEPIDLPSTFVSRASDIGGLLKAESRALERECLGCRQVSREVLGLQGLQVQVRAEVERTPVDTDE